jgi:hypothetical protein
MTASAEIILQQRFFITEISAVVVHEFIVPISLSKYLSCV